MLGACVDPEPYPYIERDVARGPRVAELTIDAGGEVTLEPGQGIGVAVAYAGDGRWSVTTACDTNASGVVCDYDVIVSTDEDAPITDSEAVALESDDDLYAPDEFAVRAALTTEADTDGFELQTLPGATVRVSALLYDPGFDGWFDWSDDPRFITWFGHGAVNWGAPTNPVDLAPDRP